MRTKKYLLIQLLLLSATAWLGSCTKDKLDGGDPLPEGKYPVEFTTQLHDMNVTRSTSDNTWAGGEEIAIKIGNDLRKYKVADASSGKITAADGVTPFFWTSTGETKTAKAFFPYTIAVSKSFTIQGNQETADKFSASDALYAAPTAFSFADKTTKLNFKHLTSKVVVKLKAGSNITESQLQNATVTFVNQTLTADVDTATGTLASVSTGNNSVAGYVVSNTPSGGVAKTVQALLQPCQMQGKAFIRITINSKEYHYTPQNNIDADLKSGKVHTYEISVMKDGIDVKLAESDQWTEGGNETVPSHPLTMSFKIDLTNYSNSLTYVLPLNNFNKTGDYTLTVDWGDGSEKTTIAPYTNMAASATTALITHTYGDAKEYTISISTTQPDFSKEQIPGFLPGYNSTSNNNSKKLKSIDTPLLNTGNSDYMRGFSNCTNLISIPADLFVHNSQITTFSECFSKCTGLSSIPENLFDYCPLVNNFHRCFDGCTNLKGSIPATLFDKNTKVTNFQDCFLGCSGLTAIPSRLFDNNTLVTSFEGCFYNCSGLSGSIPSGLFDNNPLVTSFKNCFFNCSGLSGSIPSGLFDKNTLVTSFDNCFSTCSNLTGSIPSGLFDNNSLVTSFKFCFYQCSDLTGSIPSRLFDNNPLVTTFEGCFYNCSGLSGSIPSGLFDNNTLVTSFTNCFSTCSNLTGSIPSGLFDNNTLATNFSNCFYNCNKLTGSIPSGLFDNNTLVTTFENCFGLCSNLTGQIPAGLFAKNKAAYNFSYCFRFCTKLTMNSDIFCVESSEKITRFGSMTQEVILTSCFHEVGSDASVSNDAGTVPTLWNYTYPTSVYGNNCFYGIGTVTNQNDIPTSGWK